MAFPVLLHFDTGRKRDVLIITKTAAESDDFRLPLQKAR